MISYNINYNNSKLSSIIVGSILFLIVRLLIWVQFDFASLLGSGDDSYYIDVAKNNLLAFKFGTNVVVVTIYLSSPRTKQTTRN